MQTKIAPHSIYAESTPNPATLKFVSNRYLIFTGESFEFKLGDDLSLSPLAESLLNFPFVNAVFISSNFVTISKSDIVEWEDIIPQMREFIGDFLNNGGIVVKAEPQLKSESAKEEKIPEATAEKKNLQGIEAKISEILEQYVKPAVESDGGAIDFDSFDKGLVKVILRGACSGCPSSTMTLKAGIENILKEMLPEVKQVEAINA